MTTLLTRAEAAAYLGISPKLLDEFRKDGTLDYIQRVPCGKVFFNREELRQFKATHTRTTTHRESASFAPRYRENMSNRRWH